MNTRCHAGVALLIATLTPFRVMADSIDVGDVIIFAFADAQGRGSPITLSDSRSGATGSSTRAEVLLGPANGIRFPNFGAAGPFASAAANANQFVAAGVNESSFPISDPANSLTAQAGFTQQIINNTSSPVTIVLNFEIPAPTLRFFQTETAPAALSMQQLVQAEAHATMTTQLIHPDGSTESFTPLSYGLGIIGRSPSTGLLVAVPDEPGDVVTFFAGPNDSFGFNLPNRVETNFPVAGLAPGDILNYSYTFDTFVSAGADIAASAQIGDPFDLTLTGGRFDLQIVDAAGPVTPTTPVPEPGTMAMLGVGLLLLGRLSRRRLSRDGLSTRA